MRTSHYRLWLPVCKLPLHLPVHTDGKRYFHSCDISREQPRFTFPVTAGRATPAGRAGTMGAPGTRLRQCQLKAAAQGANRPAARVAGGDGQSRPGVMALCIRRGQERC